MDPSKRPLAIEELLDVIEMLVIQHFEETSPGKFWEHGLSANEHAANVLARYRPHRWEHAGTSIMLLSDDGTYWPADRDYESELGF